MEIEKSIKDLRFLLGKKVRDILSEFEKNKKLDKNGKFMELCFCILVANFSMEKTFEIWKKIGEKFLKLTKEELSQQLKQFGYRFYNKRAEYIVEARSKIELLEDILKLNDEFIIREKLVENFRGIGWKEASHFLRNLGYKNFAILDRHVLRTLRDLGVIDKIPKTLNKRIYLKIEDRLRKIANELKMNLAELDFYLFYISSGKIPFK